MGCQNRSAFDLVCVCSREKDEEQWMIVVKRMIVISGDGHEVPKNAPHLGEIVNTAKSVGLVEARGPVPFVPSVGIIAAHLAINTPPGQADW